MTINQPFDYYDKLYFDPHSLVGEFHRRRVSAIINEVPFGSSVLDLGCSSGFVSNLLSVKKCSVTGVDIRPECVEYASKNSANKFIVGDLRNLDLNQTFDVVICSDVIEHFTASDRQLVIAVINKHLKSGGRLIMTTPGFLEHLIEPVWQIYRNLKNPGVTFDDAGTHELVSASEIKSSLGQGYTQINSKLTALGMVTTLVFQKI
ncbi:MAG: class I SAM-dependent methyltransferase [candidate division WWE3 bacterium]|nr:class I SAM-dependent methyltransferase [candidate division WWE3 bacterium]